MNNFSNIFKIHNFLNEKLSKALGLATIKTKTATPLKKLNLEELFGPPFSLGLKNKHLTRADYYE